MKNTKRNKIKSLFTHFSWYFPGRYTPIPTHKVFDWELWIHFLLFYFSFLLCEVNSIWIFALTDAKPYIYIYIYSLQELIDSPRRLVEELVRKVAEQDTCLTFGFAYIAYTPCICRNLNMAQSYRWLSSRFPAVLLWFSRYGLCKQPS